MIVKMFDVVQIDYGDAFGSEQSGIRPAIVFQNEAGNKYSPTILTIPMTKGVKKLYLPTHRVIQRSQTNGLEVDSTLLGEQMRSVDKERIKFKRGSLTSEIEKTAVLQVYLANVTGKKENDITEIKA